MVVFIIEILFKIYKYTISPLLGTNCRFTPTCSEYCVEAFRKFNFIKATFLSIKRILRCNPFGGSGEDYCK